jgi:hypothetical protein
VDFFCCRRTEATSLCRSTRPTRTYSKSRKRIPPLKVTTHYFPQDIESGRVRIAAQDQSQDHYDAEMLLPIGHFQKRRHLRLREGLLVVDFRNGSGSGHFPGGDLRR